MNVMSKWPELSYVSITMFFTNLTERKEIQVSGSSGDGAAGEEVRDMVKGSVRKCEGVKGKPRQGKGVEREWWRKIMEVTRLLKGGGDEEDSVRQV
ncbi:hypothetical protein E2C01_026908 [Portunus trituberculatus]|uniref:Uncharacterized protein n=1 Tax=Portunus trituberculatus TaxID=210409 RepID=A0A5B7EKI3_PORTR|nr:hypothetical protein [Portunus trituberculatus]